MTGMNHSILYATSIIELEQVRVTASARVSKPFQSQTLAVTCHLIRRSSIWRVFRVADEGMHSIMVPSRKFFGNGTYLEYLG